MENVSTVESQDIKPRIVGRKKKTKTSTQATGGLRIPKEELLQFQGQCEIQLCSMIFLRKQALLSDPNVWIGDTGAT
jgi:hypothetical protein